MENLALLQTAIAFPQLDGAEGFKRIARSRLSAQLSFYLSSEGVVMEHSPGYHSFGLNLLRLAFTYMRLLHESVPADWEKRAESASRFYRCLRRPDGTLPLFGDTGEAPDLLDPLRAGSPFPIEPSHRVQRVMPSEEANCLYPVSGYSIWWDGLQEWPDSTKMAQTALSWSDFPGLGHKHADDLSLVFWAEGQVWWTNVGYWPYDDPKRARAESWEGSNAPHLVNETANSHRAPELLSSAWSNHLAVIDLARKGPGTYAARRQLIHVSPELWLTIDSTTGDPSARTTTIWNLAPSVHLRPRSTGGFYSMQSTVTASRLSAYLLGSPGMAVQELHGSGTPFAGWQAIAGSPKPAWAIVTEQPAANSWSLLIWFLGGDSGASQLYGAPQMVWNGPEDWRISIPLQSGQLQTIVREGPQVSVSASGSKARSASIVLQPARSHQIEAERQSILAAHARALEVYPTSRDLLEYRLRVTYLILALFVGHVLALWQAGMRSARRLGGVCIGTCAGWLAFWTWLAWSYFKG